LLAGVLSDVVDVTAPYHAGGLFVGVAAAVIIVVLLPIGAASRANHTCK
jgi:hypothetical protein